jgi:hypothetical protein
MQRSAEEANRSTGRTDCLSAPWEKAQGSPVYQLTRVVTSSTQILFLLFRTLSPLFRLIRLRTSACVMVQRHSFLPWSQRLFLGPSIFPEALHAVLFSARSIHTKHGWNPLERIALERHSPFAGGSQLVRTHCGCIWRRHPYLELRNEFFSDA